ncbi:MAG: radical SAM protein [Candidatus Viridilinea halotolerans]|uniref:Radical SAM protein n=1 Tax=Candidatus Viridilinea halotolerans TaxID=2491704 RepID=A0A426U1C3_9CHLR|nr:MAG: radical SAM protein [Candidatus Viridilinea halotolerans]
MTTLSYSPWQTGGLPLLNVAATCAATHALGPGLRAVVWVQGCPFNCPGCVAPAWLPMRQARVAAPEELVAELLAHLQVTGLTFSGGEPMLQAVGLARLITLARQQRPLSLICFSGFTLDQLRRKPPGPGAAALLDQTDVLIDGRYVANQNDQRGLRGSLNQQIHYLTDRLIGFDFATGPRQIEVQVGANEVLLVGVPPRGAVTLVEQALKRV